MQIIETYTYKPIKCLICGATACACAWGSIQHPALGGTCREDICQETIYQGASHDDREPTPRPRPPASSEPVTATGNVSSTASLSPTISPLWTFQVPSSFDWRG